MAESRPIDQALTQVVRDILYQEIKCHTCLAPFPEASMPLVHCISDHLICGACYKAQGWQELSIVQCPVCKLRGPMLPSRVLMAIAAKLYTTMPKTCRFTPCASTFDSAKHLKRHEERCKFASALCPACSKEGTRQELFNHVGQCSAICPIILPLVICRYQTDIPICDLPAKTPTYFKGCYRLQTEGDWSGHFVLSIIICKSEVDHNGLYDKMVVELFGFFEEDAPPREDFPIKVAIRNKHTKQFLLFAPSPKHNHQIFRSTEIQGLLGSSNFGDLILKPQVRQYDLIEFIKQK